MIKYIIINISIIFSVLFSSVYNEGDIVSLIHQNQTFSVCSGDYYLEDIKLSYFNGDTENCEPSQAGDNAKKVHGGPRVPINKIQATHGSINCQGWHR